MGTEHKVIDQKAHQRRQQKEQKQHKNQLSLSFCLLRFFLLNARPFPGCIANRLFIFICTFHATQDLLAPVISEASLQMRYLSPAGHCGCHTGELPY